MTMSEFETILDRIDGVDHRLADLRDEFHQHAAVELSLKQRRSNRVPLLTCLAAYIAAAVAIVALIWR